MTEVTPVQSQQPSCINNTIWRKRINQSVNYKAVCWTAPATQGLLKMPNNCQECLFDILSEIQKNAWQIAVQKSADQLDNQAYLWDISCTCFFFWTDRHLFWIVRLFLGISCLFWGYKKRQKHGYRVYFKVIKKISICNIKVKIVIMWTIPLNQVELNNRSNIPRVCVGCSCYTELVWFLLFTFQTISRRISWKVYVIVMAGQIY